MKKVISCIIGIVIFAGIPIISRGIHDFSGYINNTERMLYTILMVITSILVTILLPNGGKSAGKGEKYQKKHKISLIALQVFTLLIIALSPIFDRNIIASLGNHHETIRIIGIILTFVGFIIMNWSAYSLGKQFSTDLTIQKNHKLVTSGPYHILRHPRYSGIILTFLGISFIFNSGISLGIVALLTIFLLWRVYDEEILMKKEFPKERKEYTKKTWKLIPYIY